VGVGTADDDWFSHGSGEVGGGRVNRDDDIHLSHKRGQVSKIMNTRTQVSNQVASARIIDIAASGLQGKELRLGNTRQFEEKLEGHGLGDPMKQLVGGHVGTTGLGFPDEADPVLRSGRFLQHKVEGRRDIRRCLDLVDSQHMGKAHQGKMDIGREKLAGFPGSS